MFSFFSNFGLAIKGAFILFVYLLGLGCGQGMEIKKDVTAARAIDSENFKEVEGGAGEAGLIQGKIINIGNKPGIEEWQSFKIVSADTSDLVVKRLVIEVVPSSQTGINPLELVVGLSDAPLNSEISFGGYSTSFRLRKSGEIQAFDGDAYRSQSNVSYKAGAKNIFVLEMVADRYHVYLQDEVTKKQTTIGKDFKFRKKPTKPLHYLSIFTLNGSGQIKLVELLAVFEKAAAGPIAAPSLPPAPSKPPAPPEPVAPGPAPNLPANVLFSTDFSKNKITDFKIQKSCAPQTAKIVNGELVLEMNAGKVTEAQKANCTVPLAPPDPKNYKTDQEYKKALADFKVKEDFEKRKLRSELSLTANFNETISRNNAIWYRFKVKFPKSDRSITIKGQVKETGDLIESEKNKHMGLIFSQIHASNPSKNPDLLLHKGDLTTNNKGEELMEIKVNLPGKEGVFKGLNTVLIRTDKYDQWIEVLVHFKPSMATDGFLNVWIDKQRVLKYNGQTTRFSLKPSEESHRKYHSLCVGPYTGFYSDNVHKHIRYYDDIQYGIGAPPYPYAVLDPKK